MSKQTRRDFFRFNLAAAMSGRLSRAQQTRPNVILFYVDELRATALRLYNPDGVETPNLARLARHGISFSQAFTPHPLCMPARVSLWTGQYSHTHGSRYNQKPMGDERTSMAGILRKAGYELAIFGKNHCFTGEQLAKWFRADFSLGSALWNRSVSSLAARIKEHRRWIADRGGEMMAPEAAPFPPEIFTTHLVNQRAVEFIEQQSGAPFALWISIPDPHTPIQTPEQFAGVMPPERVKLPPFRPGEMTTKNTRTRIYSYLIRGPELPESFLRQYLSIYYGMVAFIDHELGRLLSLLEKRRMLENTIILFASDHGDFAAEHHLTVKTGSLLDSMVHVPLLVSWPGRVAENRREEALVNTIDIMPTLLDLCGLAVPDTVEGRPLPLRPEDTRRPFVYSEYGNGDPEFTWAQARALGPAKRLGDYSLSTRFERDELAKRERAGHLQMIRTHAHKLIQDSNGEAEFYDLVKDPYELDNAHGRPEYRKSETELEALLKGGRF